LLEDAAEATKKRLSSAVSKAMWLIPLSQVHQHLGLAGQIRNGAGVRVFRGP
jgi:hypothetical protein